MPEKSKPFVLILIILVLAAIACSLPGFNNPDGDREAPAESTSEVLFPDINVGEPTEEPQPIPPSQDQQVFLPNLESSGQTELNESYPAPEEVIDPYVSIEIDRTSLSVGETFSVTGRPIQIGMPYYYLIVRDEGVQDVLPLGQVTYNNEFTAGEGSSLVLEVIEARADLQAATFTLRAIGAGNTTLEISVTGEVHTDQGALWSGAASGAVMIQVQP